MVETIKKLIVSHYRVDTKSEISRIIGLYIFVLLGLFVGLTMFALDLLGVSANECLPGDSSIVLLFGLAFYLLRYPETKWTIQVFLLAPIIPYFYFISPPFSILPNHESILHTLWTLIPYFLFFLLFSEKKRYLLIFFCLSFITLFFHVYKAGLTSMVFKYRWELNDVFINPFLTLTAFFLASLLISWRYIYALQELTEKIDDRERLINQSIRNLPIGMMLLEINKDDVKEENRVELRRINPCFERIFKIQARELKDQPIEEAFRKIFRDSFDWQKEFLNPKKNHFPLYLEHLDKHFHTQVYKISNTQIVALFSDISATQNQIRELEENKLRYQVLLEAIPDLFFIIDKDGIYTDFVFKASETLKIKPDDIIGNSIFEVGFSEKMSAKIHYCIQRCIEYDSIETIEYALEVEGSSALFEMRIVRLNSNSVVSLARDITIRKMTELKLEEAKNKAEEADRLKTAFLANISHEIRTPMNAIIGISKMITAPEFDDEEKTKFVEIIINNGKLLLDLINDMISLSKIESKTLIVKKTSCKINEMIVAIYNDYCYDLDGNTNITIKMSRANSNPKFSIITDQVLLQSALQKLVDNGIKFTKHGEVEFGYRILGTEFLEFFVSDTGIGISEKDQVRIFERFHQLDNRTTRAYGGTGLGLSLAQHFVELLGGKLSVKSSLGIGSTFSFTIPYKKEDSPLKIVR